MFNGSNCDRKSQLSGILTESLNPREANSFTRHLLNHKSSEMGLITLNNYFFPCSLNYLKS